MTDERLTIMQEMGDIQQKMVELRAWLADAKAERTLHGRYADAGTWAGVEKRLRELGREHQAHALRLSILRQKGKIRATAVEQKQKDESAETQKEKRRLFHEIVKEYVGEVVYDGLLAEVDRRLTRRQDALSALGVSDRVPPMKERA